MVGIIVVVCVAGAKAVADVDVSRNKYAMNIIMPSSEETDEFRLTFESVRSFLNTLHCHCNLSFNVYCFCIVSYIQLNQ